MKIKNFLIKFIIVIVVFATLFTISGCATILPQPKTAVEQSMETEQV